MNLAYTYLLSTVGVLIALSVHEFSHALIADRLGDPTPRRMGRLSLNPLRHLNLLGTLCMILFRFGWANPVPVDTRYFRKPRRDIALTAVAGPLSNLVLSMLACLLSALLLSGANAMIAAGLLSNFGGRVFSILIDFFYLFHLLNLSLALFNVLPIMPLDGSRLLSLILPTRAYEWTRKHERQIYLGLLIWLLAGYMLSRMIAVTGTTSPVLLFAEEYLTLTGLLGKAVTALSSGMFRLVRLIPFLR